MIGLLYNLGQMFCSAIGLLSNLGQISHSMIGLLSNLGQLSVQGTFMKLPPL